MVSQDTDLNGGAPIARFRDTLGAMAAGGAAGQGALSSSSLLYDFESVRSPRRSCAFSPAVRACSCIVLCVVCVSSLHQDTLHTCAAERLIK